MKKLLFLLVFILFLVGCGNSFVHDDFKNDLEQVIEKTDLAYEENRNLSEDEEALLDRFYNKYIYGQFSSGDENYEMNDIEKEIVRNVNSLKFYTKHDEPLSSEKTIYERLKAEIIELLETKTVPEELVDKYPTYEVQLEMNDRFESESKSLMEELEDLIINLNISERESLSLKVYLDKYDDIGFWVDGTHYLHNDETKEIVLLFWMINEDIEEGTLSNITESEYFRVKEKYNW